MQKRDPFSWRKLINGFLTGVGWIKAASLAIRILCLAALVGIPAWAHFTGKRAGISEGFAKGYAQAIKDNPPQVYNAPATVNNNPASKARPKIGLSAFNWTLGICKD